MRLVLATFLALTLALPLASSAEARGGAGQQGQPIPERELDRKVEREIKGQDRRIRSAKAQGRKLDGEVKRSKQRMFDDNDGLSHFLYGRALAMAGIEKKDGAMLQSALEPLRKATELQPGFHQAHYRIGVVYLFLAELQGRSLNENSTRADLERVEKAVMAYRASAEGPLNEAIRIRPNKEDYLVTYISEVLIAKRDPKLVQQWAERVLKINPENDAARELLGRAYMSMKDYARAKRVAASLVRKNPQAIPLRVWWVECTLQLEQWDEAIGELKTLLAAVPKDPRLQQMLLRSYMGKGDSAAALKLLEDIIKQDPKNFAMRMALVEQLLSDRQFSRARSEAEGLLASMPQIENASKQQMLVAARASVLGMLVFSLENLAKPLALKKDDETASARAKALYDEVLRRIAEADRLVGGKLPLRMLDSAQITLAILGRHKERLPYLERMKPFFQEDAKALESLQKVIDDIKAGKVGPAQQENPLVQLLQRATSNDVETRRKALHEYYELDLPFVDPVVYRRHDYRIEKDPDCRLWVVKILSRFENGSADPEIVRIAARYVGLALEDPSSMVRREAAQGLGKIGSPAGVLYLMPHLSAMPIEAQPKDDAAREALEREYNAARMALSALTGRVDYEIGDESWVRLADARANREGWRNWLDTPDGVVKRREGLADLREVRDVDPRWQLRYILADVIAVEPPAPAPIALDAYKVLRDRIRDLPAEKRQADPWWRTFPMYGDKDVNETNLPRIRSELKGWWNTARRTPKQGAGK